MGRKAREERDIIDSGYGLKHFTGRINVLELIHNKLSSFRATSSPMLMFYGTGGVGKSPL